MQPDANITLHHLTQGVVLPKLVFPEAVLKKKKKKKSTRGITPTNQPFSSDEKRVFRHSMPGCPTISDLGKFRVMPLVEMGVRVHTLIREACPLMLTLRNQGDRVRRTYWAKPQCSLQPTLALGFLLRFS